MQATAMQIIYKGVFQWFLKLIVGVQFTDCRFLKKEKQFIILANHNSHLDTLSLLASLPGELLWKVKPVAAEDYFGKTRFQASISNFFINTLLIRRKGEKDSEHDPIRKMLEAIDAGYSLILFPEGTRGKPEQMGKIKSGIARILSLRPEVKYIPVFMTGMGRSLPKGKMILLPYKASIYYGMPALVKSTDTHEILEQITGDFEKMKEKYDIIGDVRGIGGMLGVEFVKDKESKEPNPEFVSKLVQTALQKGLLLENAGSCGNVIRFLAPLCMTEEQMEAGLKIFEESILANL